MGIPALEDGHFVNLLIFDYLYIEIGGAGERDAHRQTRASLGSCTVL